MGLPQICDDILPEGKTYEGKNDTDHQHEFIRSQ